MYEWLCSGLGYSVAPLGSCPNNVNRIQNDAVSDAWRVGYGDTTWPVEYCLSEAAEPHCKLHFEPTIAILITVLNFGKN
jgi:hypothetical protein